MLSLPQSSSQSSASSYPIVQMAEDAASVQMLLEFCYPRTICPELPALDSTASIGRCFHLAKKFNIEIMNRYSCDAFKDFANKSPNAAYALAWMHEMREQVLIAARASLQYPALSEPDTPELQHIPAIAITRLYRFRAIAVKAIGQLRSITQDISWIDQYESDCLGLEIDPVEYYIHDDAPEINFIGKPHTHNVMFVDSEGEFASVNVRHWWWDFVCDIVADAIPSSSRSAHITPPDVSPRMLGAFVRAIARAKQCEECRRYEIDDILEKTAEKLHDEIERRISQIPLETPF